MNTTIPKLATLAGWAFLIYNLIFPLSDPGLAQWFNYAFIGLAAAHAVEVIIFSKKIKASDAPGLNAFLVFIFGYFKAMELPNPA